jgi:hypothetical protein
MVSKLLKPSSHIIIGLMFADVIHKQRTNSTSVIGRCDCSVSLLTCRVPNLGLDGLCVNLNRSGCKFDADSGFGIEIEFVAGESTEEIGFTDTRV